MSATNTQIVELAKRGFEPEQIANALSLPANVVEAVLTQDKSSLKELSSSALKQRFNAMQESALDTLHHIAVYSENDGVRMKAAQYILDHQLGLKEPRERLTVQNNLTFLMQRVDRARAKRAEIDLPADGQVSLPLIDVPAELIQ